VKAQHEEAMQQINIYQQLHLKIVTQSGVKNSFVVMQSEDVKPR